MHSVLARDPEINDDARNSAPKDLSVWNERRLPTPVQPDDYRTPADVDYARVVHSVSFRRLQGKTQILSISDGDFHRTRLTHSLEVSQVGSGILQHLRHVEKSPDVLDALPDRTLIETICMIHDLGHPPFGHGGEVALNFAMREHGGFEGNGQTLRILSKLEIFSEGFGSNLTRRTLLGTLKYPVPYSARAPKTPAPGKISPINGQMMLDRYLHKPPKCYMDTEQDVVDWIYEPLSARDREFVYAHSAKSLDCTIMDLADDIAYGVHDLEDAISLGLVSDEQMTQDIDPLLWGEFLERLNDRYPAEFAESLGTPYETFCKNLFSGDPASTKRQIGRLVGYMIANTRILERDFESPLFRYEAAMRPAALMLLTKLKSFIHRRVIHSPQLQQCRFKGQQMIVQLFAYYNHDPKFLLPAHVGHQFQEAEGDDSAQQRVICDYIASLTDDSLMAAYERFFSPRAGSAFDHL